MFGNNLYQSCQTHIIPAWLISNFSLCDLARTFHTISSLLIKVSDKICPMMHLLYQNVREGWNVPGLHVKSSACACTSCRASAGRAQHTAHHSVPALAFHSKIHPDIFGKVYAAATCSERSKPLWKKLNWLCNTHSSGGAQLIQLRRRTPSTEKK